MKVRVQRRKRGSERGRSDVKIKDLSGGVILVWLQKTKAFDRRLAQKGGKPFFESRGIVSETLRKEFRSNLLARRERGTLESRKREKRGQLGLIIHFM